ncbi:MAG: SRPBCC family protein, partial [Lysobacterales bacterium]
AWEKLRDFSQADQYVPGLTGLEITTAHTEGEGASRRVFQGRKLVLDETVIEWREGEGFTLRLHRGDKGPIPPLTEAVFEYGLRERDGKVYLHNRMCYRVGLGPLGSLLHKMAIGKAVANALRDTTLAQKLFYESGQKVSKEALASARRTAGGH